MFRERLRFFLAVTTFFLIFFYPFHSWQNGKNPLGQDYILFPDSNTYIFFKTWEDPWGSVRPIGYPAFLYPLLSPIQKELYPSKDLWGRPSRATYTVVTEKGFASNFERVVFLQRIILALGISLFYLSFCRWFPPLFCFMALIGALWVAPPPDPQWIMTEPLSNAFTWYCAAFLLFAPRSRRQRICVALACLSASLAYLVRPQSLSMTALCSLIFLYEAIVCLKLRTSLRTFLKSAMAFTPLLLAYGYIAWLSLSAGQIFLHTNCEVYYATFGHLAEAQDVPYMPTERAKKFTARFGEYREDFLKKMEEGKGPYVRHRLRKQMPAAQRGMAIGRAFLYAFSTDMMWNHFKDLKTLNCLQKSIFGKELTSGLWHRHKYEMLTSSLYHFISGLGYPPNVWYLPLFPRTSFVINMVAIALTAFAFVVWRKGRWPVLLLAGIHLLAILTAACGHFVLARYVSPTEAFLLLAGMGSAWFLIEYAYNRLRRHGAHFPASVSG